MDITHSHGGIYTTIECAISELRRRRNDPTLMSRVATFFDDHGFDLLDGHAVLSRSITSPNFELLRFLNDTQATGLAPLFLEYPGEFVARNSEKYHLCKLFFNHGEGKHHGLKLATLRAVDFNAWEGKPLASVETLGGGSLVAMHHELLSVVQPQALDSIVDFTDWFNKTRQPGSHYYVKYFALFVTQGILFENFLFDNDSERAFIADKVTASFERVVELFGVRPLIVELLPHNSEQADNWLYYPGVLEEEARRVLGV